MLLLWWHQRRTQSERIRRKRFSPLCCTIQDFSNRLKKIVNFFSYAGAIHPYCDAQAGHAVAAPSRNEVLSSFSTWAFWHFSNLFSFLLFTLLHWSSFPFFPLCRWIVKFIIIRGFLCSRPSFITSLLFQFTISIFQHCLLPPILV